MNQKGFSPIIILVVLGVALLGAGLLYTNPFKNSSQKVAQIKPSPSPTSSYTPAQDELVKNKEYLMKKNNLTEEGFEAYLKMAKDDEF